MVTLTDPVLARFCGCTPDTEIPSYDIACVMLPEDAPDVKLSLSVPVKLPTSLHRIAVSDSQTLASQAVNPIALLLESPIKPKELPRIEIGVEEENMRFKTLTVEISTLPYERASVKLPA
mmetsp:Transcript_35376/g.72817  ORF Transcript_35376/g.72817 Transcript_35376/m.72817 type:complete len:120 (-) Transcript_35376:121-480(-)